jgi:general nucleoside transport system permease protein
VTIETPEPTNPVKDTEEPTVEPSFFRRLIGADADVTEVLLLPVLAVLTALILGAFVIVLTDPELWRLLRSDGVGPWIGESLGAVGGAYAGLFEGSFGSLNAVSETLVSASPVILAGLSVAVGFRAGLFNIGGEGQVLVGGLLAVIVGFQFTGLPFPIHLLAAILPPASSAERCGAVSPGSSRPAPAPTRSSPPSCSTSSPPSGWCGC